MPDQDSTVGKRPRLEQIDVVRGLAMLVMALDHVREFASNAPFEPTDMAHTSLAYFFTRWVTHFCAPTFVLLAGVSVFLATSGKATGRATSSLIKRGLWLMVLEIVWVTPLGWAFNVHYGFTRLQVIWAIGGAMILLAPAARLLKPMAVLALGIAIVVLHDALTSHEALLGPFTPVWQALGDFKVIKPMTGHVVASIYPVVPWFGIMAVGYGMGRVFLEPAQMRRRILVGAGLVIMLVFVALRWAQIYGDPKPWVEQPTGLFTLLSFLNCTKYPPSLLYTSMTLGPALVLLGFADRVPDVIASRLSLLGRVPLFFYLLHLPLFHAMSVAVVWATDNPVGWMFVDSITVGHTPTSAAADYGLGLPAVYMVWAAGLVLLFPLCRRYARIKDSRRYPWLAYL